MVRDSFAGYDLLEFYRDSHLAMDMVCGETMAHGHGSGLYGGCKRGCESAVEPVLSVSGGNLEEKTIVHGQKFCKNDCI